MKGLLVMLVLITFLLLTGVVGSESTSASIQNYIDKKYTGAELEKYSYYNAVYVNFTGKYNRSLELLMKLKEKYQYSKHMDDYDYYIAKNYDDDMKNNQAKDMYKQFIANYPDSPKLEKVKEKLDALQPFKER